MDFSDYKRLLKLAALSTGVLMCSVLLFKKILSKRPRSALREAISRQRPEAIEKIHTREESVIDNELDFIVYIRNQESQKPRRGAKVTNPFLYPFEPGMLIQNYGNSYRLLFNKYPVIDKHMLLVTFQYEKQTTPLTQDDLKKAYEIITEIDGFAFFNCGESSGYSQEHKHIQIIPYEGMSRFPLAPHLQMQDAPFTLRMFDFKHFFHVINEPESLHAIYNKLLSLLMPTSYNLIITQSWMLMVSRAKERSYNKFDLNAVAYAGLLLVKNEEELKFVKQVGPLQILRDAAVKD
jgi:sulfate adenylyltransferase (ADP) / ATP adenylyltransferase